MTKQVPDVMTQRMLHAAAETEALQRDPERKAAFVKECMDSPTWRANTQAQWEHILWWAPKTEIDYRDLGGHNELVRNLIKLGRHARLIGKKFTTAVKDWRGLRVDHWWVNIWVETFESYYWGHIAAYGLVLLLIEGVVTWVI